MFLIILHTICDQPSYIILRDPERRILYSPETRPVQEGTGVYYCQAHLDPTEPDGLQSMVGVGPDVLHGNESQPFLPQATVQENRAQGQNLSGGNATGRGQAPFMPVATLAPASSMLDDLNQQVFLSNGVHEQSVSGFSNVRMNVPTNVRPLSDHDVQLTSRHIESANSWNEQHGGSRGPRPEFSEEGFESERTTRPPEGPINTSGSHASASSPYFTAQPQRETVTSSSQTGQPQDDGQLRHPEYRDQQVRYESFRNWPQGLRPTPQMLAEAGFFYMGKKDQCCCFECGEILRRWQPEDDPVEEHATLSPHCPFVRRIKANRCKVTNKARNEAVEAVQHRMENLSIKVPEKFKFVESMGFETEDIMKVLKKVGLEVSVNFVLDMLLNKDSESSASCDGHRLPPHMDPSICAVCRKNLISVTQLECRHIVCRKCYFTKSPEGQYICGVCKRLVTGALAYDGAALD